MLLNGQAVTFIAQGKYAEAETALGEALEKDPNNPETLVNLVVLAQHQGKSQEQASRLLSQLKDLEPGHPFLQVSCENYFSHFLNQPTSLRKWNRRKRTLTEWCYSTVSLLSW